MTQTDPRAAYTARLAERRAHVARAQRRDLAAAITRLSLGLGAALVALAAWRSGALSAWWAGVPLLAFVVVMALHARVLRELSLKRRAVDFYERALDRLDGRWAGAGEPGARFADRAHPYANDLDLFGDGSLFQLLCAARTRAGEEALARVLTTPAGAPAARARQEAVAELRAQADLREDLAILGEEVRSGVHPELLTAWGGAPPLLPVGPPVLPAGGWALAAALLAVAHAAALIGWALLDWPRIWPLLSLTVSGLFALTLMARVQRVLKASAEACRDLRLLSQTLARLESERFTAPLLASLRGRLDTQGEPPSRLIARLARLVELIDSRRNQLFFPIACALMWGTQLAFAIERWRARAGASVGVWLEALGELEALSSLAGYAYEHPGDATPEIVESGPLYVGEGLGHPLLPEDRCVRNDVALGEGPRLLLVSGSNMSGKSTLLRTVGMNALLALAGAPVRAHRLRLSPLELGATLRVQDSIQEGTSRFYAEITRLRQILRIAEGDRPVLFLLDEILHGTNSHDRLIGAAAVARSLLQRGAIGLITTHDLALARLAEQLPAQVANVHFEDHIENGAIAFDFRMRPGVVTRSNALELMRAVGLEV